MISGGIYTDLGEIRRLDGTLGAVPGGLVQARIGLIEGVMSSESVHLVGRSFSDGSVFLPVPSSCSGVFFSAFSTVSTFVSTSASLSTSGPQGKRVAA